VEAGRGKGSGGAGQVATTLARPF
jgi:hypothetical protein